MSTRFEAFLRTELGQKIAQIIDTPHRQIEFDAFSREGFPAVTALVSELSPLLFDMRETDKAGFNAAKQFVGWYVGKKMATAGRTIVNPSKSVPGKLFSVGAVWSYA